MKTSLLVTTLTEITHTHLAEKPVANCLLLFSSSCGRTKGAKQNQFKNFKKKKKKERKKQKSMNATLSQASTDTATHVESFFFFFLFLNLYVATMIKTDLSKPWSCALEYLCVHKNLDIKKKKKKKHQIKCCFFYCYFFFF